MSENLVDIFTGEPVAPVAPAEALKPSDELVTATVTENKESGYVTHVHLDIKKPEQYHLTSDGIEDKIEEDEYVGKNVFDKTEDATVSPTGSKVDITIHDIPNVSNYKSDLMKNLPYDVSCGDANTVKNTIYASIPPMINIAYPIVEWYEKLTGKVDYELTFPVSICLDEIADHYESLEREYDEYKRSVTTDKKIWEHKQNKLEANLKMWKWFGNCATVVMFVEMAYIVYSLIH